jgi:long-chain-fatty-acid---luciferin-component ligase
MAVTQKVKPPLTQLNELLAHYIPPKDTWNAADESLYKPVDLYRVSLEEARHMQLKAIKFTFTHHYNNNEFYRRYCEMRNISPNDIKTSDDLDTIPLIPDVTFKQHPSGIDFARWLTNIFTGDLPTVFIENDTPTFDDVINAFNEAGLVVMYSSGTSGRHTVIPRDVKTFLALQYSGTKLLTNMAALQIPDHIYQLSPNPKTSNIALVKTSSVYLDMCKDVHYAIDYEITAEVAQRAMSRNKERKGKADSSVQSEMQQTMVDKTIQWLERYDKTEESIRLGGAPFIIYQVMSKLREQGKSLDFGERGSVLTGGGWKISENVRISLKDFRKQVQDVLGIPETHCLDAYGMVEMNSVMLQCPEGHYLHTPYTYFKPLVLDDDYMPMEYGEWGRFAFLDALAQSYPGFIISGDQVRLLERCPVCDRPGPVLEPEVERAKDQEVRGCAEELRRILAEDLAG